MFDDISENDRLDVARQPFHFLEIGDDCAVKMLAKISHAIDLKLEANRARELFAHRGAELTTGSAEVEERPALSRVAPDQIDENPVTAALEVLERVDVGH